MHFSDRAIARRFLVVLLALQFMLMSCAQKSDSQPSAASSDGTSTSAKEPEAEENLADGTYSCEATNDSSGNGPYSLECTVAAESLTIHLPNGGTIDGTIETSGPGPYEGVATDSRGNSWSVTIND